MNPHNDRLVPLALIALELGVDADGLVEQFGGDVVLDEAGMRSIGTARCREHIARANAARQAEREHIAAQIADTITRANAANAPLRAMLSAIQAQPAAEPGTPALAAMVANDPDIGFNRRGRLLDELLTGENTYHNVQQED